MDSHSRANVPDTRALNLKKYMQLHNPQVWELARVVSLAARVEPELLRAARIELLPSVDAGAEADLWFSPMLQSQSPLALVLLPEVAELLRQELSQEPLMLERAYELLIRLHRHLPGTIRTEEHITYLALTNKREANRRLYEVVNWLAVALQRDRAQALPLARWATRALTRFPSSMQATDPAQLADVLSSIALQMPPVLPGRLRPRVRDDLGVIIPREAVESTSIYIRMLRRALQFSVKPLEGGHAIQVPLSYPITLELSWEGLRRRTIKEVSIFPNQREPQTARVSSNDITVRTVLGDSYRVSGETDFEADSREERAYRKAWSARTQELSRTFVKPVMSSLGQRALRRAVRLPWPFEDGPLLEGESSFPIHSFELWGTNNRKRRLLVLGAPGSGKTSLLQFIGAQFASGVWPQVSTYDDSIGPMLPILVRLQDLAIAGTKSFNWVQHIARQMAEFSRRNNRLDIYRFAQAALRVDSNAMWKQKRLIFLLDDLGTSSVSEKDAYWLQRGVADLMEAYPFAAYVITARTLDIESPLRSELEDFEVVQLNRWSYNQIRPFLAQCEEYYKTRGIYYVRPGQLETMFDNLTRSRTLSGLGFTNPLQIATLVRVLVSDTLQHMNSSEYITPSSTDTSIIKRLVSSLLNYAEQVGTGSPGLRLPLRLTLSQLARRLQIDSDLRGTFPTEVFDDVAREARMSLAHAMEQREREASRDDEHAMLKTAIASTIMDSSPDGKQLRFTSEVLFRYFADELLLGVSDSDANEALIESEAYRRAESYMRQVYLEQNYPEYQDELVELARTVYKSALSKSGKEPGEEALLDLYTEALLASPIAEEVERRFWAATNSGGGKSGVREVATYVLAREWYAIVPPDGI